MPGHVGQIFPPSLDWLRKIEEQRIARMRKGRETAEKLAKGAKDALQQKRWTNIALVALAIWMVSR